MSTLGSQAIMLPALRPDVEFHRGPDESDGSPTYTLHDPLGGTFEKLTWVQAEILRRLRVPLSVDEMVGRLAASTTIRVSGEEVIELAADASRKGLTMDARICDRATWEAKRRRAGAGGVSALFRGLVFVRIPLIHPDRFLSDTIGLARHLAGPAALSLYACLGLLGAVLLAQRFDAYVATFPYFFNLRGVICFALAIAAVKVIHEFSHAYVAKAFGNRVPTMGVVLILLFPVAYADVTDSWRMRSRRKRLLISLAGVLAELIIAGLALFVWALSPAGVVRSVSFVVSSGTLLSTLLVNLNPAMRFDGYYVLGDLLGIDNLQTRSFALARWALRRHLLGMPLAPPECGMSTRGLALMVAYALAAWAYRLVLYGGIALMLYQRFTRLVGGALLVVALYSFLVRPVMMELWSILTMRKLIRWNRCLFLACGACGSLLLWAALPLPRWKAVPATTVAASSQVIYAPGDGMIRDLAVGLQSRVKPAQVLFSVESRELEAEAELAWLEIERVRIELGIIRNDEQQRALLGEKLEELARAEARLDAVMTAIGRNEFVAEVDGAVLEWDDSVRAGMPVGTQRVLGRIVGTQDVEVICYVPHDLVQEVAVGTPVFFCSDAQPGRVGGEVRFVEPLRTNVLEYAGLAAVAGGEIAVVPDAQGRLQVIDSCYRVEVILHDPPTTLRLGQTGSVWLRTAPRSRLAELARYGYGVLVRESSL